MNAAAAEVVVEVKKLDLGCGKNKLAGYHGVDRIAFDGVDTVCDLREKWPWEDASVSEVHCSHFIEHLDAPRRIHFVNELYRVLVPKGKATIIVPHWASNRAYGDLTHQWPPVAEMWFYYLSREWRKTQAPHDDIEYNLEGYSCDFEATWGYSLHPTLMTRSADYQQHAITFWKEAAQDIIATLVKK